MITQLSVSQISKFNPAEDGCNLRWHYKYIGKRKEPSSKNQELGTEIHSQLEHTLRHGEDVLGKIAAAARPFLPLRGEGLFLEWGLHNQPRPPDEIDGDGKRRQVNHFPPEQSLVRAGGLGLIGFMDVVDAREDHILPNGTWIHEPGVVETVDYKTTKNFKWSKPAAELIKTTQMNGYAVFVKEQFPWAHSVRLSHLNLLTEGAPEARKESIVVPIEKVVERWHTVVDPIAEKMKAVAVLSEGEVEPNFDACDSFGGCPHRSYCVAKRRQKPIDSLKRTITNQENKMSLLSKVRGLSGATAAPPTNGASTTPWVAPPQPVQPTAAPVAVQTFAPPAAAQPLTAKDAVTGQSYEFNGGAVGVFLSAVQMPGSDGVVYAFNQVGGAGVPFHVKPTEPITPVGAPVGAPLAAPTPTPVAAPVAAKAPSLLKTTRRLPIVDAATEPVVQREAEAPAAPAPLATQVAAPKRGPGRPKKTDAEKAAEVGTGIRLYVGCVPNSPYETLDTYVGELLSLLQEAHKVDDIRFPPDQNHALAFDRWTGALAAAVRASPPVAGDYVAFRGSKITDVVVEALAPLCGPGNVTRAM